MISDKFLSILASATADDCQSYVGIIVPGVDPKRAYGRVEGLLASVDTSTNVAEIMYATVDGRAVDALSIEMDDFAKAVWEKYRHTNDSTEKTNDNE